MNSSDVALLEMDDDPASWWNPYFAGWRRNTSPPTIGAGIHHPGGAAKKINFDNDTAYGSGPINWGDPDYDGQNESSPSGSHWRVFWDEGETR